MTRTKVNTMFDNLLLKLGKVLNMKDLNDLEGIKLVLDPGHGGDDIGASFKENGKVMKEVTMNHKVVNYMTYIIQDLGSKGMDINYALTKPLDESVYKSLYSRAGLMKEVYDKENVKGDLNVIGFSVHHNGGGGDYGMYIHTIFEVGSQGDDLARFMAESTQRISPQQKVTTYKRKHPTSNRDYYAINRLSGSCPSIISEYAFVDNAVDNNIIDSDEDLAMEACYHLIGILGFYDYLADKEDEHMSFDFLIGKITELTSITKEIVEVLEELKDGIK